MGQDMAVCAEDFGLKHGQDLVISWMEWRVEREGGIKDYSQGSGG